MSLELAQQHADFVGDINRILRAAIELGHLDALNFVDAEITSGVPLLGGKPLIVENMAERTRRDAARLAMTLEAKLPAARIAHERAAENRAAYLAEVCGIVPPVDVRLLNNRLGAARPGARLTAFVAGNGIYLSIRAPRRGEPDGLPFPCFGNLRTDDEVRTAVAEFEAAEAKVASR